MARTQYPIRIRFDSLESQELVEGIAEEKVLEDIVRRFARPEFLQEDRDYIISQQSSVYQRLQYELLSLGRVALQDEEDLDMLHCFFRLNTAWAKGPPWSEEEIAKGTSLYHYLREKIAMHSGVPTPDNEHLPRLEAGV
jgi:hypothetical protein